MLASTVQFSTFGRDDSRTRRLPEHRWFSVRGPGRDQMVGRPEEAPLLQDPTACQGLIDLRERAFHAGKPAVLAMSLELSLPMSTFHP